MEHYGVFGASAGAWGVDHRGLLEAACDEEAQEAAEAEVAPRSADWKALLEHHGVFGAPAGAWLQQVGSTEETTEEYEAEEAADEWAEDEEEALELVAPPRADSAWKSLLEHHGVFGAPAGSWFRGASDMHDDARLDPELVEELDSEDEPPMTQKALVRPRGSPAWASLLEQYGAFGAPAGSWCRHGCADDADAAIDSEDASTVAEEEQELLCEEAEEKSLQPPSWQALLEHHGVFGAPAGAWTSGSRPSRGALSDVSADEVEDEEEEEDELEVVSFPRPNATCWKALLEQYGMFDTAA